MFVHRVSVSSYATVCRLYSTVRLKRRKKNHLNFVYGMFCFITQGITLGLVPWAAEDTVGNVLWVSLVHLICAVPEMSFSQGVLSVDKHGILELPTVIVSRYFSPFM